MDFHGQQVLAGDQCGRGQQEAGQPWGVADGRVGGRGVADWAGRQVVAVDFRAVEPDDGAVVYGEIEFEGGS